MATETFADQTVPKPKPKRKFAYTDSNGIKHAFALDHTPSPEEFNSIRDHYESKIKEFDDNLEKSAPAEDPQGFLSHFAEDMLGKITPSPVDIVNDASALIGSDFKVPDRVRDFLPATIDPGYHLRKLSDAGQKLEDVSTAPLQGKHDEGDEELAMMGAVPGELIKGTSKAAQAFLSPVGVAMAAAGPLAKAGVPLAGLLSKIGTAGFAGQGALDVADAATNDEAPLADRLEKALTGTSMLAGGAAHAAEGTNIGKADIRDVPGIAASGPLRVLGKILNSNGAQHIAGHAIGYGVAGPYGALLGRNIVKDIMPEKAGSGLISLADRLANPERRLLTGTETPAGQVDRAPETVEPVKEDVYGGENVDPNALKDLGEQMVAQKDPTVEQALVQQDPSVTPIEDPEYQAEVEGLKQRSAEPDVMPVDNVIHDPQLDQAVDRPLDVDPVYDQQVADIRNLAEEDRLGDKATSQLNMYGGKMPKPEKGVSADGEAPVLNVEVPSQPPAPKAAEPRIEYGEDGSTKLINVDKLNEDQKARLESAAKDYTARVAKAKDAKGKLKAQRMLNSALRDIIENKADSVVGGVSPEEVSAIDQGNRYAKKSPLNTINQPQTTYDLDHPLDQVEQIYNQKNVPDDQIVEQLKNRTDIHSVMHGIPVNVDDNQFKGLGLPEVVKQRMVSRVHAMLAEQSQANPAVIKHMQDSGYVVNISPKPFEFGRADGSITKALGFVNYTRKTLNLAPTLLMSDVNHAVGLHEFGHVAVEVILKRMAELDVERSQGLELMDTTGDDTIYKNARNAYQNAEQASLTLEDPRHPDPSSYAQSYNNLDGLLEGDVRETHGQSLVPGNQNMHYGQGSMNLLGNERFADLYSSIGPHRTPFTILADRLGLNPKEDLTTARAFNTLLKLLGTKSSMNIQ